MTRLLLKEQWQRTLLPKLEIHLHFSVIAICVVALMYLFPFHEAVNEMK